MTKTPKIVSDYLVPTVIETTNRGERSYDIFFRAS
mgnify:FL=1